MKKKFFEENWVLFVIFLYILLPVDLIPDSIPILGSLDDAGFLLIHIIGEYLKWKKANVEKESKSSAKSDGEVFDGEIVK